MLSLTVLIAIILVGVIAYQIQFHALEEGIVADKILVEKSSRTLTLFRNGVPLKSYSVALGGQPVGKKQLKGDGKTPEGDYIIDWHHPNSDFHLALHISYPNSTDVASAAARDTIPGGEIMIHGIRNGLGFIGPLHRLFDWTQGCVALTDAEIEELYRAVPDGTPIEIRP
ncbi:MAG TPA: hypothetical protein ENH92_05905 [Ectothiorhodospiraceae bacterium]|nr:hypothetical protein [Ectothiorhodospiraceae bacterium]